MTQPGTRLSAHPKRRTSARVFTPHATALVQAQLAELLDSRAAPASYATSMKNLGASLGQVVARELKSNVPFALVSTPEDADALVTGMLQTLPRTEARLVCYWTDRREYSDGDVATVVQKFVDPRLTDSIDTIVIAKSIVSSGCIVRTNLEQLLLSTAAQRVLVAAPVMVAGTAEQLHERFASQVLDMVTFAVDPKPRTRLVTPGVGGLVEQRLGLQGRSPRFMPALVQSWPTS